MSAVKALRISYPSNERGVIRVPIADLDRGRYMPGMSCDQCANTATAVLVRGIDNMAICDECAPLSAYPILLTERRRP